MHDRAQSADSERRGGAIAPPSPALRNAEAPDAGSLDSSSVALREEAGSVAASTASILHFDRVSKWFGPVIGVNQVTLRVQRGITGLVGHNGAGKSTLLRLAAGHLRPSLGSVRVLGVPAWSAAAKQFIGYCPENDRFYEEMSGRAFVNAMATLSGYGRQDARERTEKTLELVGMADRAHKPVAGYSKGMRQRIKLAQALLHDPALLLLDEPLSGIDPVGRRETIDLLLHLASRGVSLVISSHELDELEKITDRVAIMAAGRVAAAGSVADLRELLSDHPLTVRIESDQNAQLSEMLLGIDEVVGLDRGDGGLSIRVRHPRRFFERFQLLVIEEGIEVQRMQTMDESTQDVLGYLLRK